MTALKLISMHDALHVYLYIIFLRLTKHKWPSSDVKSGLWNVQQCTENSYITLNIGYIASMFTTA